MTAPSGADAAGARNRAAVEQLEEQAAVPVRVAIYAVLARLLDDLGPGVLDDGVAPTMDAATVAARSAWSTVAGRITAWVRTAFARLLTRAADNVDDLAPEVPGPALEDRVSDLVDQVVADLATVPDTVASRVATTLRDGYERGDTPQQLRRRVAAVLDRDEWDDEVVRIARTTTTTVYNAAHTAAANELERNLGRPLRRMWIATQDTRTRPTHRRAHAQVVESGERFRVGDARLRFPGDPLGPADEVILCRCVVVPVANDMVIDLAHRVTRREAEAVTEPIAAATQVTDTVITDLSDEFDVDESAIPGITAEDGEPDEDGRWPIDASEWPDLDAEGLEALSRIPPALRRYWLLEEGAAEIRWGTDGSFRRCQRALAEHVRPDQLDGLCANLYHAATGRWPGQNRGDGETAGAPCGCGDLTEDERAETAALLTAGDWRAKVAAALDIPVWMLGPLAGTVSGATDLPIADRDREWDGDMAADRVRTWATDGDEIDAARYGRAFFYRDPDAEPDTETAYKLGFADVMDGELTAIPAGLFAVASVLQGGRGGVDIPEADQEGIRTRVGGYYRRMAEQFDDESLTPPWDTDTAGDTETDGDTSMDTTTARRAPSVSAANLDDARTGAMIALVPTEADAGRLAVAGDEATTVPAEELHTTLLFLGEGADWAGTDQGEHLAGLAERIAADVGPITGTIWQAGATGGDEPTAMYLVGDDTGRLAELHVNMAVAGGEIVPPQHSPYVAHISTRYGDGSTEGMDQLGTDVVFDRMRVSYGPETVDYPLTGDDSLDMDDDADEDAEPAEPAAPVDPEEDEMTETATATTASATPDGPAGGGVFGPGTRVTIAPPGPADTDGRLTPSASLAAAVVAETVLAQAATNAPEQPPAEWFRPVAVDGPTPPTVTAEGRVWGHIGQSVEADGSMRCHVGITDECVPIPPTRTGYGAFHREEITTAEGDMVAVGYLYTGCDHSDLGMDIDQARGYLDAACTRTAAGRVYDTDAGPMFVGSLLPGVSARNVAQLWKLSGEWFTAPLELHAAVGVDDAGFPVDGTGEMVRVAEAGPEPLAAAADDGVRAALAAVARSTADVAEALAAVAQSAAVFAATPVPDNDGAQRPEPGDSDDEECECPENVAPEDCECPGADDDAPAEEDARPVQAVADIDRYRAGRARRTTDTAVNTAASRRARRQLGHYDRRG